MIRHTLQRQLDALVDAKSKERAASERERAQRARDRRHDAAQYAQASRSAEAAAKALFVWANGSEGLVLRARMRREGVVALQIGPAVVARNGKRVKAGYKGCCWLFVRADEKPTFHVQSLVMSFGGPNYLATTPRQLLHQPENRFVHGCEALVVAAAESLGVLNP